MRDGNFRYAASNKDLEDRIKVKMEEGADTIYWHIKFNLNLDKTTVTRDTMYVTDLGGFVLESYIYYDEATNLIVISPLESYEENFYYILNITTKVKSAKGQNLKKPVIILFKLLENEIAEMQVLPPNVKTPAPIRRPRDYDADKVTSKVFQDGEIYNNVASDKLKTLPLKVNPIFAIIGVAATIALSIFNPTIGILVLGITVVFIGMLLQKVLSKSTRAVIVYNAGVREFNAERYKAAKVKFNEAFLLDSQNETIEYALSKVEYFL